MSDVLKRVVSCYEAFRTAEDDVEQAKKLLERARIEYTNSKLSLKVQVTTGKLKLGVVYCVPGGKAVMVVDRSQRYREGSDEYSAQDNFDVEFVEVMQIVN